MRIGDLPQTALILVFVAVFFVAGFLALGSLTEQTACPAGATYDAASEGCYVGGNLSQPTWTTYSGNASLGIQEGMDNVTDYAGTWGTIIGISVLLAIVIGGFAFGRSRGYI